MSHAFAGKTNDMREGKHSYFSWFILILVGVFKNRGTPKWMVYNGKPY